MKCGAMCQRCVALGETPASGVLQQILREFLLDMAVLGPFLQTTQATALDLR